MGDRPKLPVVSPGGSSVHYAFSPLLFLKLGARLAHQPIPAPNFYSSSTTPPITHSVLFSGRTAQPSMRSTLAPPHSLVPTQPTGAHTQRHTQAPNETQCWGWGWGWAARTSGDCVWLSCDPAHLSLRGSCLAQRPSLQGPGRAETPPLTPAVPIPERVHVGTCV